MASATARWIISSACWEAYGPERCRVCLAEYEGEPLAAAIALHYGRSILHLRGQQQ